MSGDRAPLSAPGDLVHLVLGIHGVSDRMLALIAIERTGGGSSKDGPLADALLGFLAFARSVRAGCLPEDAVAVEVVPAMPADEPRDLLR